MNKPMEQYINEEIMGDDDGEFDEHKDRLRQQREREQIGDLSLQTIGVMLACQSYKIPIPEFPLSYQGFGIMLMSGRNLDVINAMKKFVSEAAPKLQEAHDKQSS